MESQKTSFEKISLEDQMAIGWFGWSDRLRRATDSELDDFTTWIHREMKKTHVVDRPLLLARLRSGLNDLIFEGQRREKLKSVRQQYSVHLTLDEKNKFLFLLEKQMRLDVLEGRGEKAAKTIEQLTEIMAEVKALDNQYGEGWL